MCWIRPNARALRNYSDLVPAPNDNLGDIILTLESSDHTNLEFYSSRTVAEHCKITEKTFRTWRSEADPPTGDQIQNDKGKKLFRIDYLKKVFDQEGSISAREKLETIAQTLENDPEPSAQEPHEEVLTLEWARELVATKTKMFEFAQDQLARAWAEKDLAWAETVRTKVELAKTQFELDQAKKKLQIQEVQLKLTENQPKNWLSTIIAFFERFKTKQILDDNNIK